MKTKSSLFRSTGALLALLVFIALPSSTALASCGQTDDVDIYYEYALPTGIHVEMECKTTGAIIYYTLDGSNPTHDGSGNPTGNTYVYGWPIPIPYGQCFHFRARAWKPGIPCYYDSVNISDETICNPIT
ncbi:MAG TPA: chitobiase/beta-hexosaminidase C-terminal domain-containing protein [Chthoniobacterales bacterium]|nr:chitobiase/beta-hexosaminidase C-terminal domain-containing protein [Chthoniobacterales bacterium]